LRLVWAVSCRSYELREDRTADIEGAGVNQVWVDAVPAEVSLPLLLRLGFLENEPEAELRIELLGPEMSSFGELTTPISASPGLNHRPGDEVPIIYPVELLFDADREGNHSAEIYCDLRHETSVFFVVRAGAPED
jgi:hypothetical protein